MNAKHEANRKLWNRWTPIHQRSAHYGVDRFRTGALTLLPAERELLGDVAGKSLLHLQCHFGLDTLSWARLGASVTGVDISDEAIALAEKLATETGLLGRFIRCDLYDLPNHLNETFDIVFTSYGVLTWLADLPAWGRIVARYLKPGGRFCIVESHPFACLLGEDDINRSYFDRGPHCYESERSYVMAPTESHEKTESWEWSYTLSDVVNAIAGAGLRIERMQEYSSNEHQRFMFQANDGTPEFAEGQNRLPVVFSLIAGKY